MEELNQVEEKKVVPLKSTADKLEISEEELKKIREASMEEYANISASASVKKSRIPAILILTGILILVVLIFKTVTKTSQTVDSKVDTSQSISVTVDENGNIINSEQHIPNK